MNPKLIYTAKTKHQWPDVEAWCLDHIGQHNETWYKLGTDPLASMIEGYEDQYYFDTEEHRNWFILRWGDA